MNRRFRVALTGDFYSEAGAPKFRDMGLTVLEAHPCIDLHTIPEHKEEIGPDQVAGAQGVIVLTPRVTARTSSWRVIDQKPPSSGATAWALKWTGASRCILANNS